MKYQFIAGYFYGIVEAENEDEAREKLRLTPELSDVQKILLKKLAAVYLDDIDYITSCDCEILEGMG